MKFLPDVHPSGSMKPADPTESEELSKERARPDEPQRNLAQSLSKLNSEQLALLTLAIKKKKAAASESPQSLIFPAPRDGKLLPSHAQQRLWFIDQLEPGSSAYNLPLMVRIKGQLKSETLKWCLNEITRRHEILRADFTASNGTPELNIAADLFLEIEEIDLSRLENIIREQVAKNIADTEIGEPFVLDRRPLVRVKLLRMEAQEHLLLVNMHHIVSDAWSERLMVREFIQLYQAAVKGEPSPLEELQLQYADFAMWQREWLKSEMARRQQEYWVKNLTSTPVTELPADYQRPTVMSRRGEKRTLFLNEGLTEKLKGLGRREGVTVFMTLLAGFQLLLARYSGQEEAAVGAPIAGRNRKEVEGLIGLFANTLVMRTGMSGNPTVQELLGRVRETTLSAYANQDLPFDKLVEELQPERSLNREPVFQVMFIFQKIFETEQLQLPGLCLTEEPINTDTARFDITLSLVEDEKQILGMLIYAVDLYERDRIERLSGHLKRILEVMATAETCRVMDISLLTEAEWGQLIVEYNRTEGERQKNKDVADLFEEQARWAPDAVAAVYENEHVSYAELARRADNLTRRLTAAGGGPEIRTALCMERGLDMVIGLLGALKAGSPFVPLDPEYPPERLDYMLGDSDSRLVITQRRSMEKLPNLLTGAICIDTEWEQTTYDGEADSTLKAAPDNLAYVIYTSGSTGRPKGVAVKRAALSNFVASMGSRPALSRSDIMLAITSLSFDISMLEVFLPLVTGARLVVASQDAVRDGSRLIQLLVDSQATHMQATPATWRLLVDSEWEGVPHVSVLCGGETLPRDLAFDLAERCGRVWNLYGPTETTIWSSLSQVDEGAEKITIGRPIMNTRLYILDASLQPVPIGMAGELYIGGAGLARGYLNQADLTAERFVPNRFAVEPGERLYRTGDLAQYLDGDNIQHLGRIDDQVKVRGYRIEPGEIESLLNEHPAIDQAVVALKDVGAAEKLLVAYVVVKFGNPPPESEELREHLRKKLPDYMTPSAFVELLELPLTFNGKLDRKALPLPGRVKILGLGKLQAPRDSLEITLKRIWEDVLGIADFGIRDNFFQIGGHSLAAIRLAARIAGNYGPKISLRTVFEHPTIEQLASFIRRQGAQVYSSSLVPLQTHGHLRPLFCAHPLFGMAHSYLILSDQLGRNQPVYCFQSHGLEEGQTPLTNIESMAALYINEMRTVQPTGPYQLTGLSMGALLAFEMAQQLKKSGEQVSMLALLDADSNDNPMHFSDANRQEIIEKWERQYLEAEGISELNIPAEEMAALDPEAQLARFLEAAKAMDKIPEDISNKQFRRWLRVRIINQLALLAYRPASYDGPVTLVTSTLKEGVDPTLGWEKIVGGKLETHVVAGAHGECVNYPGVTRLAEILTNAMAVTADKATPDNCLRRPE